MVVKSQSGHDHDTFLFAGKDYLQAVQNGRTQALQRLRVREGLRLGPKKLTRACVVKSMRSTKSKGE